MDENLEIIQKIMILAIKLDTTQSQAIEFDYHSASGKLTVSVCTERNPTFNDGLTRTWNVSVRNKELLNAVLEELKSLQPPIENPVNEDDFLGE